MKKNVIIGTALALAAGLLFNPVAFAQKTETKNKTATGVIKDIDSKEKTITVKVEVGAAEGKDRTIEVPGSAKIDKDNKINLKLKDLKIGDKINITYKQGKEPGPDHKTMIEVMKAVKITVLASADAAGAAPPK